MDAKTKLRYLGAITTPPLWKGSAVADFEQIDLNAKPVNTDQADFRNRRLGKLVEEFVFYQLKHEKRISWIDDNLQIQDNKITVGEIDALYYDEGHPVHLEIAYKFYLYDKLETYNDPLAYWIGPNRKDTLAYKLQKFRNKQFSLLHNPLSQHYLTQYSLSAKDISQKLCFKAQLFLPYQSAKLELGPVNPDCVAGFYLSFAELEMFDHHQFYIPDKLDWLIKPILEVDWIDSPKAKELLSTEVANRRSPMIWVKGNDDVITKCFVVFW